MTVDLRRYSLVSNSYFLLITTLIRTSRSFSTIDDVVKDPECYNGECRGKNYPSPDVRRSSREFGLVEEGHGQDGLH
jgi:hypothetical protein